MSVSRGGGGAEKRPDMAAPPVPGNTGPKWGKGGRTVAVSRKAAGCLGGSQRRHGMAYGAAGKQHGVAEAYTRRNTQGRAHRACETTYLSDSHIADMGLEMRIG